MISCSLGRKGRGSKKCDRGHITADTQKKDIEKENTFVQEKGGGGSRWRDDDDVMHSTVSFNDVFIIII